METRVPRHPEQRRLIHEYRRFRIQFAFMDLITVFTLGLIKPKTAVRIMTGKLLERETKEGKRKK